MDFEKVLHKAKKNEKKKIKEPVNCYRTTFSPPKKEERSKGLSANIQKFLAKKDEEERRKKQEDDRKREELLALRNQDGKARKRVQVMLKRTKSANKSVLNDAIDTVNTADTINGPKQCDEDDYGYESQEASKFYNKMMEKYNAVPVEEKKSYKPNNQATAKDLVNTKDRVRQALLRQGEDELIPHKRRRRNKDDEDNVNDHRSRSNSRDRSEECEKIDKPKPKRPPMPPPLDFSSLLKIAEKKQFEPVVVEKKVVKVKEEPERLMTKKEKLEHERQKDRERKVSEYSKASSSKSRSDDVPRNINGTRDSSHVSKDAEKLRSKEEERFIDKNRDRHRNQQPMERSSHSNSKSSSSKYTPESHHSSQSRSRSRSPLTSKDRLSIGHAARNKLNHKVNSPSADRFNSTSSKTKDDSQRINIPRSESKLPPTSLPKIPKIQRVNEEDRKMADRKVTEKDRMKEKEKLRELEKAKAKEREKEKEKLKEKEREKARDIEKEREKEKERQRLKEKMERERQKEREREKEKLLDKQREADREREKAREKLKDRESEKERERRDRREKDSRESSARKSSSSSDKLKQPEPKKASKYDKLDLFGERDSVSPERPSLKTNKTSDSLKKNLPQVKTERIKVVEDTTRDLFDNPVTIVRKQLNDKNTEKSNPGRSSSSKPEEKPKLSSSSKATTSIKHSLDKSRPSCSSDRKRDMEDRGNSSDKRPKLEYNSKPQSSKDNFKKPLPPEPRKQFPPKDLQRKDFPPRDLQRKEFPPRDLKPKQFPPRDLKPKQFPPSDLKSRQFPPPDVRRGSAAANRKRFEYERSDSEDSSDEDEDEYDDDLDGFIDDGPTDNAEDISRYIKDIFGYDKSKYLDDDGDIEVSSFAEQMREESRSARLGLIEDLEDMAMEQREKRRKALQRMKRGRR